MHRLRSLAVITALVASTVSIGALPASAAATHDVSVTDFQFTPATTRVIKGDAVRWTFVQGGHTVTSDATPPLFDGASPGVFTHTFNTPGRFGYHCEIHPAMKGAVLVDDGLAPGAVATLSGKPADRRVFLSWTYSKPADFDHFEVRRFAATETPVRGGGTSVYSGRGSTVTASGLVNGTTYKFAIWSIDFAGNASPVLTRTATPVLLATSLQIARSASTVVYGQSVRLRGTLRYIRGANSFRLRGEIVSLYARPAGQSTWKRVKTARSNSDGVVTYFQRPTRRTSYQLRHARTVFYGASTSRTVTVGVQFRVTSSPSSVFTGIGVPIYVRGSVRPLLSGRLVELQRRIGTRWTRVASGRMSSTGTYSMPYTPRSGGAHVLRVFKPAEPLSRASVSPSMQVTATNRTLRVGSTGSDVRALQQQLARLHYDVGAVNGTFGYDTLHAVVPFQKVHRLGRDGIVGPLMRRRLANPVAARMREVRQGAHVEVDLTKQVIMLAYNGDVWRILDTSSGNGQTYTVDGDTRRAITPTGRFAITRKIDGTRVSHLGELYRPAYFHGGYAIHGSKSVPPHPASHGCLRVTNPAQDRMFRRWVIGTPVWVFRS